MSLNRVRPSPLLHLALLGVGAALAQGAWVVLDIKMLAFLGGLAAQFCILCAGVVWALRDKSEERLISDDLNSAALQRATGVVSHLRAQFTPRAAWVAVLAIVAGSPAASQQLASAVWQVSVILCGLAVAEAAYSYVLAMDWDTQLRQAQADRKLQTLKAAERADTLRRMHKSLETPPMAPWVANTPGLQATSNPH